MIKRQDFYSKNEVFTAILVMNAWLYEHKIHPDNIINIQQLDNHNHLVLWYY